MISLTDIAAPIWRANLTLAKDRADVQARLTALRDTLHGVGSDIAACFEASMSMIHVIPLVGGEHASEIAGMAKRIAAIGYKIGEELLRKQELEQNLDGPLPAMPAGESNEGRLNDMLLGEILVQFGFVTKKDIGQALSDQAIKTRRIGQVLMEKGVISAEDLTNALRLQQYLTHSAMSNVGKRRTAEDDRLGQILLRKGWIHPETLVEAMRVQRQQGGRLGEVLVGLAALTWDHVNEALRDQQKIRDSEAQKRSRG